MTKSRHGLRREVFDDLERDHFAGNLGKALDAAANVDEVILIEINDVACTIPPNPRELGG